MILNPNNIGINIFNIADEIVPKYYYLEIVDGVEEGSHGLNNFSMHLASTNVNLTNSVIGTIEEIEEQLKYFVWEHIKNFETITSSVREIVPPIESSTKKSIGTFHHLMQMAYLEVKLKASKIGFGYNNITNISLHIDAKDYIYNKFDFNIHKLLNINVTINNNLPRNKMIFTNVSNDTISHGNVCLVYKNIDNGNQTFTTMFAIIAKDSDMVISVDLPSKVFRKNKIEELL